MVLTHPFHCPVHVVEGHAYDEALQALVGGRSWSLVTSAGWIERGAVRRLADTLGEPVLVAGDVPANPTVSDILRSDSRLARAEVVVALGGGSVLDAAKGMVAFNGIGRDQATLMRHLRDGEALPEAMAPLPIIAVPTTSGTGSEVTRWGTVWGDDAVKHSVTDAKLFPTHAVLDPALCASMPRGLTLATALDALSHAMESVWNRRHTPVTDSLAETAIAMVRETLPAILDRPADLGMRARIQSAALIAGLAMGTTQTAVAHSISYPFTARYGVPHGIACSFTLAEVARFNAEADADRLRPIASGVGCRVAELPETLSAWLESLGVGAEISRYVAPTVTDELGDNLITRARAANNIREVDGATARALARAALDRLCPAANSGAAVARRRSL